jgi:aryl-alcohol dehydrogenase-like predicted oxidoreductase
MRYRRLAGGRLPDVSVVALGTMSVAAGAMHDAVDARLAADTIRAALDAGINFFDTAPAYGDGESESRLGDALRDARAPRGRLVIATKASGPTLSRDEILRDCDASLRRLRTDYIDVYQLHWRRNAVPLAESLDALASLRKDGKVREIGVCNFGPRDMADAWACGAEVVTDQVAYSLFSRGVEFGLASACEARGVGILCYSPLAQGLLTGKYQSADEMPPGRCRSRHFAGTRPMSRHGEAGCEAEVFKAVAEIRSTAAAAGCTVAELSLAWLLHQPAVVSVLGGASTPEQVVANARAAELQLDDDTIARLNRATARVKAHLGDNLDMWQGTAGSRIH